MYGQQIQEQRSYDILIIRPEMRNRDVRMKTPPLSRPGRKKIKKALRTLHTLELMAVTIYRFQITNEPCEHNRQLIAAMCNEMTHYQDFQIKLYEYGLRPSIFRWAFWFVGFILGFGSRLMGKRAILKTGIWVEAKAVAHYDELLSSVEWDEDSRSIIEKDQADEKGHIARWRKLLQSGGNTSI